MTAVEFIEEQIKWRTNMVDIILEAKKMEKKQIMEAWLTTKPISFNGWKNEFEKYYNENFKIDKK